MRIETSFRLDLLQGLIHLEEPASRVVDTPRCGGGNEGDQKGRNEIALPGRNGEGRPFEDGLHLLLGERGILLQEQGRSPCYMRRRCAGADTETKTIKSKGAKDKISRGG